MDAETLRVLEYDKIRQLLAQMTATGPGRELALALHPLSERHTVAAALAETVEMTGLLAERGAPPVGGGRDLRPILAQLQIEGTYLQPPALLEVLSSIDAAGACRRFFVDAATAPLLSALAAELVLLRDFGGELRASIGPRGEILDGASFELGTIRHNLLQLRSRIRGILEGLLQSERLAGVFQDRIVTERGGRYVVPVRADHRGQLKGFVHDESASGQTLFVEPVAVLELNNRLQTLRREEQREEERILRRLSAGVRRESESLAANQAILARLDFLAAAGRFSRQCDGVAPELVAEPLIDLHGARHPLLLFQSDGSPREGGAVPVDLRLGEGQEVLVISGPNTGGKTVALKTVGLLLLLVRSGLPIPCRVGSRVHLFERIFADIGDEQSIEASLSTYAGHLHNLKAIVEGADERTLVLIDELGSGTDPEEGAALSQAILEGVLERGARGLVTTHLAPLKVFASET
ncbi:MAG TPA: endonuclease MutS2, partial [Desulfuromonadales bacterium]|nr:endonuclease MutS2 [Desulfuromonadales bacterium]